jgi:hypothetical protein
LLALTPRRCSNELGTSFSPASEQGELLSNIITVQYRRLSGAQHVKSSIKILPDE